MKKPYLNSIEYIRGVSMLGVVAIHIGAQYLTNPTPNVNLIAVLEIASRFSVPIFFFISAFGLFYKIDLSEPFDYEKFLRRRFKAVLLPYLIWSALYIIHDSFFYSTGIPAPESLAKILFFGLAKYQLYFLVILIWFYLLMPLWIKIIKKR
jgi:surface polysaccharide O-acyltransferase-like enzyme